MQIVLEHFHLYLSREVVMGHCWVFFYLLKCCFCSSLDLFIFGLSRGWFILSLLLNQNVKRSNCSMYSGKLYWYKTAMERTLALRLGRSHNEKISGKIYPWICMSCDILIYIYVHTNIYTFIIEKVQDNRKIL